MSDVIVIGVAGGTGSGKTTLVKALVNRFGDNISVLSHDNYYKRHDELTYRGAHASSTTTMPGRVRYRHDDRPFAACCKNGPGHRVPDLRLYDPQPCGRDRCTIEPRKVIVVEGILIFASRVLCDQMDIKIFVDADADVRLCRRIRRDVKKRGRTHRLRHRASTSRRSSPCTSSSSSPARKTRTSSFPRAARTSSRWK